MAILFLSSLVIKFVLRDPAAALSLTMLTPLFLSGRSGGAYHGYEFKSFLFSHALRYHRVFGIKIMKEEKMPLILKHIVWLKIAWQGRYLTDKPGFLFIGTQGIDVTGSDVLESDRKHPERAFWFIREANCPLRRTIRIRINDKCKLKYSFFNS